MMGVPHRASPHPASLTSFFFSQPARRALLSTTTGCGVLAHGAWRAAHRIAMGEKKKERPCHTKTRENKTAPRSLGYCASVTAMRPSTPHAGAPGSLLSEGPITLRFRPPFGRQSQGLGQGRGRGLQRGKRTLSALNIDSQIQICAGKEGVLLLSGPWKMSRPEISAAPRAPRSAKLPAPGRARRQARRQARRASVTGRTSTISG